jgi:hypothetical protein
MILDISLIEGQIHNYNCPYDFAHSNKTKAERLHHPNVGCVVA